VTALVVVAGCVSSCAYYNTFYLARRYYFKATAGAPYEVDRKGTEQAQNYSRAIDYSKKLLAQYPKSKWVDDAWLLWAKSLIGRDDPLETMAMLQDYSGRFPRSARRSEATFYLGLAYRNARRYAQAVDAFDDYLTQLPKGDLAPYAHLERSRALMSLKRYGDAADAASQVLQKFGKSPLADLALRQRAEARLQNEDFDGARQDFHDIGARATNETDRIAFLMREVDCLEAARRYDDELAVLRSELGHTPPPPEPLPNGVPAPPGSDRYGKLTLRIGTALMLSGQQKLALEQYDHVMNDYPKSALSAEAQYRIGYLWETVADDFDRAVDEYAKVKEQFGVTQYTQLAQARADDIGRIMQFRKGAGADSLEKKAEAGFLTAERFLFELKKPERALEEYGRVVTTYPGTAVAGRALNAQAWVLSRKLSRGHEADSLFWKVVREYPATEAQIAARDYLESEGATVPDSLIRLPVPKAPPPDTTKALTPIPSTTPALGIGLARTDSLRMRSFGEGGRPVPSPARDSLGRVIPGIPMPGSPADSLGHPGGLFGPSPRDSSRSTSPPPAPASPPPATPTPPPAPAPAPTDTTRKGGGH
jgi:TolA-binding protein